jgi:dihydrofolate reductase
MRKIIYYVATSIDGFISGPNDDISGFAKESKGIEKYLSDLKNFDTVIMGRKTYEFGYKFGLNPGEPAYPHMKNYIFSNTLKFDITNNKVNICKLDLNIIKDLKSQNGSDIYLCGGGEFAGWLLDKEMIDILKIKLNPLILGNGVPLFGSSIKKYSLSRSKNENYDHGLEIITYSIEY